MHVFVTGATGFIGRPTLAALHAHSHTTLSLTRSPASTQLAESLNSTALPGSLADLDALRCGAEQADAVIHLGFIHDFSDWNASLVADRAAIQAIAEGLKGSGKRFVVVSGTLTLRDLGRAAVETDEGDPAAPLSERVESEKLVIRLGEELGFKGMVVRLAALVHGGDEDWGFTRILAKLAKEKNQGELLFVEKAENGWPAVHRNDAAEMLTLLAEKGQGGKWYHGVAEEGVPLDTLCGVIAKKTGLTTKGVGAEEVKEKIGLFGEFIASDNPTSSKWTRESLGWVPKEIGLLEDVEKNYFVGGKI